MTAYEQIREQFNESAVCRHKERPRLEYEPGCLFIECSKASECRCRLNSGEGGPVSAFLIDWSKRFASG
jgi:hypothetical protein